MTDYVSICGLSAAGKKTLIQRALQDREGVRERFGLKGTLRAFGRSFEPLDQMMLCTAQTVLFQWQWVYDEFLDRIGGVGESHTHRIVVLWRPLDEQFRDVLRVYGTRWQGNFADFSTQWNRVLLSRFRDDLERRAGLTVEVVDASKPHYPALRTWPVAP